MRTFQLAIDTGGTFTDCLATDSDGNAYRRKVLSNGTLRGTVIEQLSPTTARLSTNWNLTRDVLRGYTFRTLGESATVQVASFNPTDRILHLTSPHSLLTSVGFELTAGEEAPVLAARLVTETALDDTFPPLSMRLGSTKGTNALLEGKGAKVAFFVTEGFADLLRIGDQSRPDLFSLSSRRPEPLHAQVVEVMEQISAAGDVIQPLEIAPLTAHASRLAANSVAICLKNAYRNPAHEQALATALRQRFRFVSVSTELSPHIKFLARAETTVVNAYLAPIIHDYLNAIQARMPGGSLHVMTSAGALAGADRFQPKDSLLSGPAGGVVGAAAVALRAGFPKIITFDMGGTSTDVARYDGAFDYRFETTVGAARLQAPALAIETVAAGGGSACGFDGFRLFVGPESAGSNPGPACYGAGGPLTITDVNLLLGRLDPTTFGIPVFPENAQNRLDELLDRMAAAAGQRPRAQPVLEGFVRIADETMAEAIRKISLAKGYDPTAHALVAFGGAGGLHACGVARLLGIRTILLPADAGLLSAVGIGGAALERFAEATVLTELSEKTGPDFQEILARLRTEACAAVRTEGVDSEQVVVKDQFAFLRLKGQETSLELDVTGLENGAEWRELFREKYVQTYGHWVENRAIEVESLRVRAGEFATLPAIEPHQGTADGGVDFTRCEGPTVLADPFSTAFIGEGFALTTVTPDGTRILEQTTDFQEKKIKLDAQAELELFTNRFRAVAEQMGAMLQRTAVSVNVKERLDFSCALLNSDGRLVANAPHIPVHLGSLGVCVRRVREAISMNPGDVIVTNHPGYGGSHLPDVTLITPVFEAGRSAEGEGHSDEKNYALRPPHYALIGYVVNRCHHAEIGGIRPGSMPPNARNLAEEGVVLFPMKLVEAGEVRWGAIRHVLTSGPCPTRNVDENLADLAAALAANRRGEAALRQLVVEHGLEKVHFQMAALLGYSAQRMRQRLAQVPTGSREAEEFLDDGTRLSVRIEKAHFPLSTSHFTIDFTGTAPVHPGNLNGTEAIARSVVMYVLRVLLNENVPLNEGLLEPVYVNLPPDSILNPDFPANPDACPAVVGGNVELSQRLTGLLLKAFGIQASSQGTMNNVLFGNGTFGYYETLGGGGGAVEGFAGTTACQQHMTNTRITDPEILERRYPLRLRRFQIRHGSGGRGRWPGGDGLVREYEFLEPIELSLLTQHRVEAPYGRKGGQPGQTGRQWLVRADGTTEPLGGAAGASLQRGDRLVVQTPGGGGWGMPNEKAGEIDP